MKKKINLNLVGLNGNAFALLAAFSEKARKEGWSKDEINEVLSDATNGDYNHLVATLSDWCHPLD